LKEGPSIEPCLAVAKNLPGCDSESSSYCSAEMAYSNENQKLKEFTERDFSTEFKALGLTSNDVDVEKLYAYDLTDIKVPKK
jgi:hypothetical protein